jgi:hypothetical protein
MQFHKKLNDNELKIKYHFPEKFHFMTYDLFAKIKSSPDIDLYEMYNLLLYQDKDFLEYCANDKKLSLPQIALYINIFVGNISMCNICISHGCKMNEKCMTIACACCDIELVKYCMKFGLKPSSTDINIIITKKSPFNYRGYYVVQQEDLVNIDNIYNDNLFIARIIYYLLYARGDHSDSSRDWAVSMLEDIVPWYLGKNCKYSEEEEFHKKIKNEITNLLNWLKENNIELTKNNIDLCYQKKIFLKSYTTNEKMLIIENLCDKFYKYNNKTINEIINFVKENKKLSDTCYDNFINNGDIDFLLTIPDLDIEEHNIAKLIKFAVDESDNDLINKITDRFKDKISSDLETKYNL